MQTYRFLGTVGAVGSLELTQFGQRVTMSEEQAFEAVRGGCALLPDAEFQSIGFSSDELLKNAFPSARPRLDPSFQAKRRIAIQRLLEFEGRIKCNQGT